MKYLLLIHNTQAGDDTLEAALDQPVNRDRAHGDLVGELAASGELVGTSALDYERTLVTRKDGAPVVVTDGPFAETREIIGGYYLVDVDGLERAVTIAARLEEARFAPVEVRALV